MSQQDQLEDFLRQNYSTDSFSGSQNSNTDAITLCSLALHHAMPTSINRTNLPFLIEGVIRRVFPKASIQRLRTRTVVFGICLKTPTPAAMDTSQSLSTDGLLADVRPSPRSKQLVPSDGFDAGVTASPQEQPGESPVANAVAMDADTSQAEELTTFALADGLSNPQTNQSDETTAAMDANISQEERLSTDHGAPSSPQKESDEPPSAMDTCNSQQEGLSTDNWAAPQTNQHTKINFEPVSSQDSYCDNIDCVGHYLAMDEDSSVDGVPDNDDVSAQHDLAAPDSSPHEKQQWSSAMSRLADRAAVFSDTKIPPALPSKTRWESVYQCLRNGDITPLSRVTQWRQWLRHQCEHLDVSVQVDLPQPVVTFCTACRENVPPNACWAFDARPIEVHLRSLAHREHVANLLGPLKQKSLTDFFSRAARSSLAGGASPSPPSFSSPSTPASPTHVGPCSKTCLGFGYINGMANGPDHKPDAGPSLFFVNPDFKGHRCSCFGGQRVSHGSAFATSCQKITPNCSGVCNDCNECLQLPAVTSRVRYNRDPVKIASTRAADRIRAAAASGREYQYRGAGTDAAAKYGSLAGRSTDHASQLHGKLAELQEITRIDKNPATAMKTLCNQLRGFIAGLDEDGKKSLAVTSAELSLLEGLLRNLQAKDKHGFRFSELVRKVSVLLVNVSPCALRNLNSLCPHIFPTAEGAAKYRAAGRIRTVGGLSGIFSVVAELINAFYCKRGWTVNGIVCGPLQVAFDSTSIREIVSSRTMHSSDQQYINHLVGFTFRAEGGEFLFDIPVHSREEIIHAFETHRKAGYALVGLYNALFPGLPIVAAFVIGHNNEYTSLQLKQWLLELQRSWTGVATQLPVVQIGCDMEAKNLSLIVAEAVPCKDRPLPDSLAQLSLSTFPSQGRHGFLLAWAPDPKHVIGLAYHQLLAVKKFIPSPRGVVHISFLYDLLLVSGRFPGVRVVANLFRLESRQDKGLAMDMCTPSVRRALLELEHDDLLSSNALFGPRFAMIVYLFLHDTLLQLSLSNSTALSVATRVELSYMVKYTVLLWRAWVVVASKKKNSNVTLKRNFMTRPLLKAIMLRCESFIHRVRQHREKFPGFPISFEADGSDYCESFFRAGRSIHGSLTMNSLLDQAKNHASASDIVADRKTLSGSTLSPEALRASIQVAGGDKVTDADSYVPLDDPTIKSLAASGLRMAQCLCELLGMKEDLPSDHFSQPPEIFTGPVEAVVDEEGDYDFPDEGAAEQPAAGTNETTLDEIDRLLKAELQFLETNTYAADDEAKHSQHLGLDDETGMAGEKPVHDNGDKTAHQAALGPEDSTASSAVDDSCEPGSEKAERPEGDDAAGDDLLGRVLSMPVRVIEDLTVPVEATLRDLLQQLIDRMKAKMDFPVAALKSVHLTAATIFGFCAASALFSPHVAFWRTTTCVLRVLTYVFVPPWETLRRGESRRTRQTAVAAEKSDRNKSAWIDDGAGGKMHADRLCSQLSQLSDYSGSSLGRQDRIKKRHLSDVQLGPLSATSRTSPPTTNSARELRVNQHDCVMAQTTSGYVAAVVISIISPKPTPRVRPFTEDCGPETLLIIGKLSVEETAVAQQSPTRLWTSALEYDIVTGSQIERRISLCIVRGGRFSVDNHADTLPISRAMCDIPDKKASSSNASATLACSCMDKTCWFDCSLLGGSNATGVSGATAVNSNLTKKNLMFYCKYFGITNYSQLAKDVLVGLVLSDYEQRSKGQRVNIIPGNCRLCPVKRTVPPPLPAALTAGIRSSATAPPPALRATTLPSVPCGMAVVESSVPVKAPDCGKDPVKVAPCGGGAPDVVRVKYITSTVASVAHLPHYAPMTSRWMPSISVVLEMGSALAQAELEPAMAKKSRTTKANPIRLDSDSDDTALFCIVAAKISETEAIDFGSERRTAIAEFDLKSAVLMDNSSLSLLRDINAEKVYTATVDHLSAWVADGPQELAARLHAAVSCAGNYNHTSIHAGYRTSCDQSDAITLCSRNWLNHGVIDFLMLRMLSQHRFVLYVPVQQLALSDSTLFKYLRKEVNKSRTSVQLVTFLLCANGNHWVPVFFCVNTRRCWYGQGLTDSVVGSKTVVRTLLSGGAKKQIQSHLRRLLAILHQHFKWINKSLEQQLLPPLRSSLVAIDDFPVQTDSDNCGVISMMTIAEVTAQMECVYTGVPGTILLSDLFKFPLSTADRTISFSDYCYRVRYHLMHEVLTACKTHDSYLLTLARRVARR